MVEARLVREEHRALCASAEPLRFEFQTWSAVELLDPARHHLPARLAPLHGAQLEVSEALRAYAGAESLRKKAEGLPWLLPERVREANRAARRLLGARRVETRAEAAVAGLGFEQDDHVRVWNERIRPDLAPHAYFDALLSPVEIREEVVCDPAIHGVREPPDPPLGLSEGTLALLDHFGNDPREALRWVIDARGGDRPGSIKPEDRRKAWEVVQAVVGGLADPGSGAVDRRLRDLDHYLNAHAGVSEALPHAYTDSWLRTRFKVLGREGLAVGGTAIALGYSAVKWFDQTTGAGVGKFVGRLTGNDDMDFNAPNASRASWGEVMSGLRGNWRAAFDTYPYRSR